MTVAGHQIEFSTQGETQIQDLTGAVQEIVKSTSMTNGIVTVFCPGSTHGVTTIEFERGALTDLKRLFDEIAAPDREYLHNERWGDGNGHSHVRAALIGPSLTVPFVEGQLTLGRWQQIIHIDFDNRPRQRTLAVQVLGE
jgi:secondary thiamine-phosphate synthase enzyme